MDPLPRFGLVLLTGGKGERLGGPKHDRPHPSGGSWGGHLLEVFRALAPEGPVAVVGSSLPDHPEVPALEDPRQGPAVALRTWAAQGPPPARRWWVVACDQVRWTSQALEAWLITAEAADPEGRAWVVMESEGQRQPLGGFLGGALVEGLAAAEGCSLKALMEGLPVRVEAGPGREGRDIDTRAELREWDGDI